MGRPKNPTPEPVLDYHDHSKVLQLEAKLAEAQAGLPQLQLDYSAALAVLTAAQVELDQVESLHLAERATDTDLAAAQSKLASAKRGEAIAKHTLADGERTIALLKPLIVQFIAEAKAEAVANLRAAYAEKLTAMCEVLRAGQAAHDELEAVHRLAHGTLPFNLDTSGEFPPRPDARLVDLGPAGFASPGAGLPHFDLALFSRVGWPDPTSTAERYLKRAEAFLADELPHMAADDLARGEVMPRVLSQWEADKRAHEKELAALETRASFTYRR